MTQEDAGKFRFPFGKYIGRSLEDVCKSDEGLLYCDWLMGEMEVAMKRGQSTGWPQRDTLQALKEFLDNPAMEQQIEEALERKRDFKWKDDESDE